MYEADFASITFVSASSDGYWVSVGVVTGATSTSSSSS